ncbi:MAG: DUF1508 domain-containing protein [Ignavibacteriales bacterium]|nr:DUF1508 domain-containing protein [Ignavibacteriales bacterium]
MSFEIFRQTDNKWYWRFVTQNNEVIAASLKGYDSKDDCLYSISIIKSFAFGAKIVEKVII